MTANHEYTPTTFRGPDPTYVVSLKYAAGSRQVKMSPQEIEKAIESIITAAEQRGAIKAIRQFARDYSSFYFSSNDQLQGHLEGRARMIEQDNRADQLEDDDE